MVALRERPQGVGNSICRLGAVRSTIVQVAFAQQKKETQAKETPKEQGNETNSVQYRLLRYRSVILPPGDYPPRRGRGRILIDVKREGGGVRSRWRFH